MYRAYRQRRLVLQRQVRLQLLQSESDFHHQTFQTAASGTGAASNGFAEHMTTMDKLSILLVMHKDDAQCQALRSAVEQLGGRCDCVSFQFSSAVRELFNKQRHELVFIDRRELAHHSEADSLVSSFKQVSQNNSVLIALTPSESSAVYTKDVTCNMNLLMQLGYNRRFCENANVTHCINELLMLKNIDLVAMQQQKMLECLKQALNYTTEAVEITDPNFKIMYINRSHERMFGRSVEDVINRDTRDVHHSEHNLPELNTRMEEELNQGSVWCETMYSNSAHSVCVKHCREIRPLFEMDRDAPHHFLSIIRKHNDVRKSSAEGSRRSDSATHTHKGKFHIEPRITKVVNALKSLKESVSGPNADLLEETLEVLYSTDLYAAVPNRNEDSVTTNIVDGLLTSSKSSDKVNSRKSSAVLRRSSAPRPSEILTEHIRQILDSRSHGHHSLAEIPDEIVRVMEDEQNWGFDIFSLENVTTNRPLVYLSMKILDRFNVLEYLKCTELTLRSWLQVIEDNYHSQNMYHNSTHAADVLQCSAYFLDKVNVKEVLTEVDEVSSLLSAIVHDLDHPGRTNAYLANTTNRIAVLYNDRAVLENHHISLTFQLTLKDDRINIFKNLDRKTYQGLRELLVEQVLATEMVKHYEHVAKFTNKITPVIESESNPANWSSRLGTADNRSVIRCMLIKCSDVSNPLRPFDLCKRWAQRICEEYFCQTEEENKQGIPNSMPGFDRRTCVIPQTQIAFIGVLRNMFEGWHQFAHLPEVMNHLEINVNKWTEFGVLEKSAGDQKSES